MSPGAQKKKKKKKKPLWGVSKIPTSNNVNRPGVNHGPGEGALAVLSAPHNYGRICLWNAGMYSTNGLWATLRGVVPNSTLSHVRLIRRVLQQNKEVRFDLYVTRERVDQTLSSLKRFMRHWLFYFRLHSQERLEGFCFLPNITCVCLPVSPGVSRE